MWCVGQAEFCNSLHKFQVMLTGGSHNLHTPSCHNVEVCSTEGEQVTVRQAVVR